MTNRALQLAFVLSVESAIFATGSPYFLSATNVQTILQNAADLFVVSAGMAIVLTLGGVDISVGSVEGISAIMVAKAVQSHWGALSALLGPLTGAAMGLLNGVLVAYGRIPAIIATLGTMNVWRAAIFLLIGGRWISGLPDVLGWLIQGSTFGVPVAVGIPVCVYALSWYLMRLTPLGPRIHAIGNSSLVAAYVGIPVRRISVTAYMLAGTATGVAAVLYVARYQNVEINVGSTLALEAIAACVLGGTSVLGGELNLLGTALGVLFVAVLRDGLVLLNLPSLWEQVIVGVLLIAVLSLDFLGSRLRLQHTRGA